MTSAGLIAVAVACVLACVVAWRRACVERERDLAQFRQDWIKEQKALGNLVIREK